MGAFFIFLLLLYLIIYFPYLLIKWAIFGHGLFFPSFKRMSKKLCEDSFYSNYEPGCWLMLNYYILLILTIIEYIAIASATYAIIYFSIEYFNLNIECVFYNAELIYFFLLFLYPILQPVWFFVKLAQWGNGFFHPDFEEMKNNVDNWRHYTEGFFAFNRLGGKIKYYFYLIYFFLFVIFVLYVLFGIIHIIFSAG